MLLPQFLIKYYWINIPIEQVLHSEGIILYYVENMFEWVDMQTDIQIVLQQDL